MQPFKNTRAAGVVASVTFERRVLDKIAQDEIDISLKFLAVSTSNRQRVGICIKSNHITVSSFFWECAKGGWTERANR